MSIWDQLRVWWVRWILREEAVVLQDYRGEIYHSRCKLDPDGDWPLFSWVYPHASIGPIWLLENGEVSGVDGIIHYITRWVYLDRQLRCEQVLRGAEGFEF